MEAQPVKRKQHFDDDRTSQRSRSLKDKNQWRFIPLSGRWFPAVPSDNEGGMWVNENAGQVIAYAEEKMKHTGEVIPDAIPYPGDEMTRTVSEQMFRTMKDLSPVWMRDMGENDWVPVHSVDQQDKMSYHQAVKFRAAKLQSQLNNGSKSENVAKQFDIASEQAHIIGSVDTAVRSLLQFFRTDPWKDEKRYRHVQAQCKKMLEDKTPKGYIRSIATAAFAIQPGTLELIWKELGKHHLRLSVLEHEYAKMNDSSI